MGAARIAHPLRRLTSRSRRRNSAPPDVALQQVVELRVPRPRVALECADKAGGQTRERPRVAFDQGISEAHLGIVGVRPTARAPKRPGAYPSVSLSLA